MFSKLLIVLAVLSVSQSLPEYKGEFVITSSTKTNLLIKEDVDDAGKVKIAQLLEDKYDDEEVWVISPEHLGASVFYKIINKANGKALAYGYKYVVADAQNAKDLSQLWEIECAEEDDNKHERCTVQNAYKYNIKLVLDIADEKYIENNNIIGYPLKSEDKRHNQLFNLVAVEQKESLPEYKGEFVITSSTRTNLLIKEAVDDAGKVKIAQPLEDKYDDEEVWVISPVHLGASVFYKIINKANGKALAYGYKYVVADDQNAKDLSQLWEIECAEEDDSKHERCTVQNAYKYDIKLVLDIADEKYIENNNIIGYPLKSEDKRHNQLFNLVAVEQKA